MRGVIYDIGRWGGALGGAALLLVGSLDGTPALYTGAGALVLLSISNFIAKKHIAE